MKWPTKQIDRTPPSAFRPPFCPRRHCSQHRIDAPRRFRYSRAGKYTRRLDHRCFPRFRCLACGSRFSQPAFSVSYYLKRPELLAPVAAGLNAGSAHRQIARSLSCAPSTVTRLSARLGRHALLLQAYALSQLPGISEPVVFDHFESFVVRQEEALGLATPVGQSSWFIFGADPAPHPRGGKRTRAQQDGLRRKPVGFPKHSHQQSTGRMLDLLLDKVHGDNRLQLISDGHPAYSKAIMASADRDRIDHRIYRNPKRGPRGEKRSGAARIRDRQMKAVDVLHGLLRHTCAHHRRETIAFGRRTNAAVERVMLTVVWRNFVKKVTERRKDQTTAAMAIGLADRRWSWGRVLAQRLFPERIKLPRGWMKVYRREWITASIGSNTLHRSKYAY